MANLEITTHVQRPLELLPDLLEQFVQCLGPLEADTAQLRAWLAGLNWSPDGSDFGALGESLALHTHGTEAMVLEAKPNIFACTAAVPPGTTVPWIELSLVLTNGTEEYGICVSEPWTYPLIWKYPRAFGAAVLEVMWRLNQGFPESGVYFSTDPSVDKAWDALISGGDDLWEFGLAIIPNQMAPRFSQLPDGYARVALPGAIGIAQLAGWMENPLAAAQDVISLERVDGV